MTFTGTAVVAARAVHYAGIMADSDILTAKINYGFDHLDVDGDGRLTEHDHVLMGQRVAAALGHEPGSEAEAGIIAAYLRIWRDLHLPHIPGGGTEISKEQFLRSTLTLATDPAAAQATVGALAEAFLAIADTDHDGEVDIAEFRNFVAGHFPGLSDAEVHDAFAHLDTDGDGHLSTEEFTRATVEYWSSADPDAPGNWWMGTPIYLR
ncbi:EF-hand domain-containing protein [Kutzneria sp. CA-103260]|uniref:EF-hand domain-containing protein n=1 Tax=Kutzneria sp. CA-103260 TaxID=2802641 RepID=UPI001BEF47A5|nr:EF-hand domain-containing protein [Kutzneria sp. CA-103260]QUQ64400.1 calcium-binding protein [Kutzneria sp. CA-103260]